MKKMIIVGAGILGASAAYHLAKAGASVTIVDRQDPGQATDAAAGIICPWLTQRRNKAWYSLAKAGAAFYPNLIKQLEKDGETETGYERVGAISLHTDDEKLRKMIERALKRREDAPEIGEIKQLSQAETSASFPFLSDEYRSVYISGAARVYGRALRTALIHGAQKYGAVVVHGSAKLNADGKSVLVEDQHYIGDSVIITVGAWASDLLEPLGINLQVSGQKAQIVHLQDENSQYGRYPVVIPPNNQYILPFDDGKVVIGATHEDDTNFDQRVTASGLHEIFDKALAVAPGLAECTFVEARVGFRPHTPNFLPIIGEVPGFKNLFLANGLGASGLTIGPFLGDQLAKLALSEKVDIDLDLYRVESAIG